MARFFILRFVGGPRRLFLWKAQVFMFRVNLLLSLGRDKLLLKYIYGGDD